MIPTAIRVFPLSKIKEPDAFGTREKAFNYFDSVEIGSGLQICK